MNMMKTIAVIGLVLGCIGLSSRLNAADAVAVPAGKALYDKSCAACHGATGEGNKNMAKPMGVDVAKLSLVHSAATLKLEEIADAIKKGKGKMTGYQTKLKPEQINSLASYVKSFADRKPGSK